MKILSFTVESAQNQDRMSPSVHRWYIGILTAIVVAVTIGLGIGGYSYYNTALEERFYHPLHQLLDPAGTLGHGLGISGTLLIMIGVFGYMIRKRSPRLRRIGVLKYWLEFHIFLCTLGPVLILYHTAFKFGGIVSIAFWSMVAVVASGVVGRFIYIRIPRTIQGRELSLAEINADISTFQQKIKESLPQGIEVFESNNYQVGTSNSANNPISSREQIKHIKKQLRENKIPESLQSKIISLHKSQLSLQNRIKNLSQMQRLFRYWHVAHLPFAIIMFVIVLIHVIATLAFGVMWNN